MVLDSLEDNRKVKEGIRISRYSRRWITEFTTEPDEPVHVARVPEGVERGRTGYGRIQISPASDLFAKR